MSGLAGNLGPERRRRLEELVRPLYVGLDGEDDFGRVGRLERRARSLAGSWEGEAVDGELLDLLCLLHGAVARLGSLGPGGRLDLFLRALGLAPERSRRIRNGLARLERDPRGAEETVVHDALLLEEVGVPATARRLLEAGRRRLTLAQALAGLETVPREAFRTAAGAAAAARLATEAERWIGELAARLGAPRDDPGEALDPPPAAPSAAP